MNEEVVQFINEYSREVEENNAAVFAGAGLSVPAGYVNWKELVRPLALEIGLDVDKEENLIAVAQYHYNEHGQNRNRINQILVNQFAEIAELTENHSVLARLPISTYWTTNYDKLIEIALERASKVPDAKYTTAQLAVTRPRRDAVVYKMHGDVDHSDKAVLTKDDYESYHVRMAPFITALSGDLVSKTFLFIGFSFSDPNLDYILSRVRISYTENQRRHYAFLRRVVREAKEDEDTFQYRLVKQDLFIKDLRRFNIKAIVLETYDQVTEVLRQIELKHKQRTIFIGGSAHEYGGWGREAAEAFMHELSAALIKKRYRIISGFGLGIGSAVINGALQTIYSDKKRYTADQLVLRPFPQSETGEVKLANLWEQYRQDMISYAGIGIFVFGNRFTEGQVRRASGLEREFRIAVERGCLPIPIGATGYVSEELYNEILTTFSVVFPRHTEKLRAIFKILGAKDAKSQQLIDAVLEFIALLHS